MHRPGYGRPADRLSALVLSASVRGDAGSVVGHVQAKVRALGVNPANRLVGLFEAAKAIKDSSMRDGRGGVLGILFQGSLREGQGLGLARRTVLLAQRQCQAATDCAILGTILRRELLRSLETPLGGLVVFREQRGLPADDGGLQRLRVDGECPVRVAEGLLNSPCCKARRASSSRAGNSSAPFWIAVVVQSSALRKKSPYSA